jgi:hypothetical protein
MNFNAQQWLKTVKHTIHSDGSISVQGDVDLSNKNLTKIPFKFRKVSGGFYCAFNQLTSLNGCPSSVDGNFHCYNNQLTSLNGCPSSVDGYFFCFNNQLTSLSGCPSSVDGNFYCYNNKLTSLSGCPSSVDGNFNCAGNLKDFTELDIENAMRASRLKSRLSSQALNTFSDIIDEL